MYGSLSLNELRLMVYNFVSFSACDYAITIISRLALRLGTEKQELRSPSTRTARRKLGPPHWWVASRTWMTIKALLCLVCQVQNTLSKLIQYHACLLTDGMLAKILTDLFYTENCISIYIYIYKSDSVAGGQATTCILYNEFENQTFNSNHAEFF